MHSKYPRKPSHLPILYFVRRMGIRLWLGLSLALPLVTAAQTGQIKLSKPYVLSSTDSELIIEIPVSLPLNADSSSTVRLASPEAHNQKGLHYPAWLSDAVFQLRQANLQRPSLRIRPQRGNPEPATDFLLEFVLQGKRYWQPYHLLLEQTSSFEGKPIPLLPTLAPYALSALPSSEPPSMAPQQRVVTAPPSGFQTQTSTKTRSRLAQRSKKPAADAEPVTPVPPVTSTTPAAPTAPMTTVAPPELPASAISVVAPPSATTAAAPVMPNKREVAFWQQLGDWQILLLGSLLLLCAGFFTYRLWQARQAKRAGNAPLLTRQTEFQPSGSAQFANTVFGLDDTKANDMHQKWFDQKNNPATKK
jgi:hypothetical protein